MGRPTTSYEFWMYGDERDTLPQKKEISTRMVHTFVATYETQGQRANDFCFVPEGELVTFLMSVCSNNVKAEQCGCNRSMSGVTTHTATTTMKVVEAEAEEVKQALSTFFREAGWSKSWDAHRERKVVEETFQSLVKEASHFTLGTIVEFRSEDFYAREREGRDGTQK